jgi:hypothetical protein
MRVAGHRTGKNRWVRAFYKAGHVTASNVSRVMHVLWLEITGLLFLLLALLGAGAAVREYRHGTGSGPGKMLLAASFAVIFTYFAASSFWRAQRKK